MRQDLERELKRRGRSCRCIRCREIGSRVVDLSRVIPVNRQYTASLDYKTFIEFDNSTREGIEKMTDENGSEYFLTFESENKEILLGFLRLRLCRTSGLDHLKNVVFEELIGSALIRELHVYGQMVNIGLDKEKIVGKSVTQHQGFGTKLMEYAFDIAKKNGYKRIAVVAGTGVKDYYITKFRFIDTGNFLIRDL
jgi:histone acetyltransferase (RNA polymerase elongator complex component)